MNEETRIALLETNMTELKQQLGELRSDIKALSKQIDTLLTQKFADNVEMRAEMKSLNERLIRMERSSNLWKWVSPTLSALFTAVFTFLVLSYLQHLK